MLQRKNLHCEAVKLFAFGDEAWSKLGLKMLREISKAGASQPLKKRVERNHWLGWVGKVDLTPQGVPGGTQSVLGNSVSQLEDNRELTNAPAGHLLGGSQPAHDTKRHCQG